MSDSHYSAPESSLVSGNGNISELIEPLIATRKWVRLCSIVGFIFTGLILIATLVSLVGANLMSHLGVGARGFSGVITYLILLFFFLVPSYYLFRYASAITAVENSHSPEDLSMALEYQKSFWKFVGIVTLVYFAFLAIAIIVGVTTVNSFSQ